MHELILASTSPYRRRMLKDAGLLVRSEAPGVDEDAPDEMTDVVALVEHLALRKARAVSDRFPGAWVIGADQLAHDRDRPGEAIGKPPDPSVHLERLAAMRGRSHVLVTGFAVITPGQVHVSHEQTVMHVRADLTDEELAAYVATGEGSGCAAGYAVEGRGAFLFDRIEGDFFNVMGLPLLTILGVLRELGWRFGDGL